MAMLKILSVVLAAAAEAARAGQELYLLKPFEARRAHLKEQP
jgi:hypothetical protein